MTEVLDGEAEQMIELGFTHMAVEKHIYNGALLSHYLVNGDVHFQFSVELCTDFDLVTPRSLLIGFRYA